MAMGAESLQLVDGSRVGVIGGGPAGSLFSLFLLRMADAVGLAVGVDIYEPRHFTHRGPAGCNHCGGIVSESLVQLLASEGIPLPPTVVRQGLDSYVLHTDLGDVRIQAPRAEKRIAALYRGNGPRESEPIDIIGFDRHLLDFASSSGAAVIRRLVKEIRWEAERPCVVGVDGTSAGYDLVVVATGVNSQAMNLLKEAAPGFEVPQTQGTFICEFGLGHEAVDRWFGTSMHVFLLYLPRLVFAALIPKGEFVTLCLLGEHLDDELVASFLDLPEVRRCFPDGRVPRPACHCFPRINVAPAVRPYGDRMLWIGDCGVARLYKDGIGSAYRTAKAGATAAVLHGISARDFERHYMPACNAIAFDNMIARVIFAVTHLIQRTRILRRGMVRMTADEQSRPDGAKPMSGVLWDVFTGSAPYRDVLLRTLRPDFPARLAWSAIASCISPGGPKSSTGV